MTEATQLGADEAGFRGRPSAAGPCRLPREGARGQGFPRSASPHLPLLLQTWGASVSRTAF